MVVDSSLLAESLRHLAGPGMAIAQAKVDVPRRPGLYAVLMRVESMDDLVGRAATEHGQSLAN